jgi:hypothetical protein
MEKLGKEMEREDIGGMGYEKAAIYAALLAHESELAGSRKDGEGNIIYANEWQTQQAALEVYGSLAERYGLAGDSVFVTETALAMLDPANQERLMIDRYREDRTGEALGRGVTEQAKYLIQNYLEGDAMTGEAKGGQAAWLRGLSGNFNLGDLFGINPCFMNEDLRDFLNLKEDGTDTYQHDQVAADNSGWQLNIGKDFHLDPEYTGEPADPSKIEKYVNPTDGREVVFGSHDQKNWYVVTTDLYKGTYNYGNPFNILPWMDHYKYDMLPYFKQFPEREPWYAELWRNITK